MSEEITKVMDQQRNLELEYARLVQQRDQLKGISNKAKLKETRDQIMVSSDPIKLYVKANSHLLFLFQEVARELKESTKKLCRQLQKKPDVEGNAQQVLRHRKQLTDTINNVIEEMNGENLSYNDFRRLIEDQIMESGKYEQQREKEKQLINEI